MSTLFMQRSRKDGDRGAWSEGITSSDRSVVANNIMETIRRKHTLEDDIAGLIEANLTRFGYVHVDTTSYEIREFEEGEPQARGGRFWASGCRLRNPRQGSFMQTELTTTPHPHDPHADDLTWAQAEDVLHYFGAGRRLHFHRIGIYSVVLFEGSDILQYGGDSDDPPRSCYEDVLQEARLWPDPSMCPPPPRFVAIGPAVMLAGEQIATARGNTMAKRIAHALNWYKPGRRGT